MEDTLTCCSQDATFSQVFGRQGQLMQATVQSLNNLNDQIAQFMVSRPWSLSREESVFLTGEQEGDPVTKSMTLMRHLLMDAQGKILKMMEDNKQLARRIDGAIRSAGQEVSNLRSELTATNCRLVGLGAGGTAALENHHHRQHKHHADSLRYRGGPTSCAQAGKWTIALQTPSIAAPPASLSLFLFFGWEHLRKCKEGMRCLKLPYGPAAY